MRERYDRQAHRDVSGSRHKVSVEGLLTLARTMMRRVTNDHQRTKNSEEDRRDETIAA